MRIAIVSREVVPFFGAGIGTYAAEMSRAWSDAGHEVHFLSEDHKDFPDRGPAELRATCHAVSPEPEEFHFAGYSKGVRSLLTHLHALSPFDYIEFPDYWAEGYYSIRSHRSKGALSGAILGIRLHTPTHECRELNGEPHAGREIAGLERLEAGAIKLADLLISPSTSLLSIVRRRLPPHPLAHTCVVPYPFRVDSISAAHPSRFDSPTVLYFGRLERRKGVELLVEVGQRLLNRGTNVSFLFIGGDTQTGPGNRSMLGHLRSLVPERFRDRFQFQTPRPRHELFSIIRGVTKAGGVCCFPSIWENFPNVCLEAMSLGSTVVGSDAGGMSEIIEDGVSGLLFRSGDPESLDAALTRALTDDTLRRSVAAGAPRRIATLCDPTTVVAQMIAAIEAARVARGHAPDPASSPPATLGQAIKRLAARAFRSRR
jgi:glycosyltransferase involved in cell wall biosynthesis